MGFWADTAGLLFPNVCAGCGQILLTGEKVICLACKHNLPYTNYHKYSDNPVANTFKGRVKLEAATSFLYFRQLGITQRLMHGLKYKGHKEVGLCLGNWMGEALKETDIYNSIDIIMPVPLYEKRENKRGYNQCNILAQGMAEAINKTVSTTHLLRVKNNRSQTKLERWTRWTNVQEIFKVEHISEIENKHILLLDDVVTTGATLEACASLLVPFCKVSIATLAIARDF